MSIAKILVPVRGSKRDDIALATAFAAARPFNAHVEALFVHADPREAIPYSELSLTPETIQDLVDTAELMAKEASKAAWQSFKTAAARANVKIVDVPQKSDEPTVSYRKLTGWLPRVVTEAALLCDLVVFPPIAASDDPDLHDTFVRVLTGVRRPVLLSAESQAGHIGRKIAIGWDGRDAAAHALVSALPYLGKAGAIELLVVQPAPSEDAATGDARAYLALHGLRCSERIIQPAGRPIADVLLEAAASSGCDMLVVGGYGHSRMIESIFGGVTASIVSHARLPIFMVH